ncbi:hypothetical protein MASR2M64_01540 [Candidatus Cloacimonadota bacterium]
MKKLVYVLVLILLALTAGCDLFKPDDTEARWIERETYDFPIYVGDFAGYVHTDAEANLLGNVSYGGAGDGKDWQLFEYLPDDLREQPQTLAGKGKNRDSYDILVKAVNSSTSQEFNAVVYLNGISSGCFTPHTFTHEGIYDSSLEDSYTVALQYVVFSDAPEVSFDQENNTYTYLFTGFFEDYPPELSYFTATLTEEGQVLLAWPTQSETEMLGFRLYRSDTYDPYTAHVITNELIPATNTSELHVYYYTDTTVIPGNIYYYWMEYVFDVYPSSIHGPAIIDVSPAINWVSAAYPNPCQESFKLSVDVKVGTTATMLLLDQAYTIRKTKVLGHGSEQLITTQVGDLEPGLYRVYIWFQDGHYTYGDVLIERW